MLFTPDPFLRGFVWTGVNKVWTGVAKNYKNIQKFSFVSCHFFRRSWTLFDDEMRLGTHCAKEKPLTAIKKNK